MSVLTGGARPGLIGTVLIAALVLAAVPTIATLFMPDFYLGKQQNAITNTGLDGERVDIPSREDGAQEADDAPQKSNKWYARFQNAYRRGM